MGAILYKNRAIRFCMFLWFLGSFAHVSYSLTCGDVRQLIYGNYLRLHFSAHEFNPDLAQKTLVNYIRALDPGKVYFLKNDVDAFTSNYSEKLPRMIKGADCSVVDILFSLYSRKFNQKMEVVKKLIEKKHSYKIDEYLELDRKKMEYGQNEKELEERWRKRIKFQHKQLLDSLKNTKKAKAKLAKRYMLLQKRHEEMDTDDVYGLFLASFSAALDPHSDYFSPSRLEEFRISTRLSLEGIGALLRVEDGFTTIQSLIPGGAAKRSGKIKVEDKIVAVAQATGKPTDVIDMDLRDVVKLIRGPRGTEVRLTVQRNGNELIVSLIREKIQLQDRDAKSKVHKVKVQVDGKEITKNIGVIDLPSFYIDFEGRQANRENFKSSSRDMLNEILALKRDLVDGIVVDLRTNGGGSLDEAIDVAGLFTGPGPIVQIKGQTSRPIISKYQGKIAYKGPLVVLIDRQSASASEIFAGAIKDCNRGIIVGDEHTFGKGTVQNLVDLNPKLGAIKVTISKFYRPAGESTQLRGVSSDIRLPSLFDVYEIGEKHYDYALPWEKIDGVKHGDFKSVQEYLSPLKAASTKRIDNTDGFKEVARLAKAYTKEKEKRLRVSLKEKTKAERLKEEKERKELEKKEKTLEKDDYGNIITKIEDDPQLREAVFITADYSRLIKKEKLGDLSIIPLAKKPEKKIVTTSPPKKTDKKKK